MTYQIELTTKKRMEFIDITDKVKTMVKNSAIVDGIATIYSAHTTSAIRINENEGRLMNDFADFLENLAPSSRHYLHDDVELRDCPPGERLNGHAHIKSLLLGASETVPIRDGKLCLGLWQSIFFVELDGSRSRKIEITIIGE